jgi:hypothetical protein
MTYQDRDQNGRGNKPVEVLRDGALKLSIFRNEGEQGPSYSMVPGRLYTDKEGQVRETSSFGGAEALRMAHLMTKGHERVLHHREQDKEQGKEQQAPDRGASGRARRGHREHFNRENGFDRER